MIHQQTHSVTLEQTLTKVCSSSFNHSVVLSFRGTVPSSLKNWVDDLESAVAVQYKNVTGAAVGYGFYSAYLGIREQVLNATSVSESIWLGDRRSA